MLLRPVTSFSPLSDATTTSTPARRSRSTGASASISSKPVNNRQSTRFFMSGDSPWSSGFGLPLRAARDGAESAVFIDHKNHPRAVFVRHAAEVVRDLDEAVRGLSGRDVLRGQVRDAFGV